MNEEFKELLEENPYLYFNVYCQGELYERHELPHRNCEYCGWNGSRGGDTLENLLNEEIEKELKGILWESIYEMDNPYFIEVNDITEIYYAEDEIAITVDRVIMDIISEVVDFDISMNIDDEIYYLNGKDIGEERIKRVLESILE